METNLVSALVDQSGVLLLAVLLVWRIDKRLDSLIERIDALIAVTKRIPPPQ